MKEPMNYTNYSRAMRLDLSDPQQIDSNGDINHRYFLVKKGTYWSEKEDEELLKYLNKHPIGDFSDRTTLLDWSEKELELRTCIIFKINDIRDYMGKTFTSQEIQQEAHNNELEGVKKNKFKNGVYEKF